MQFRASGRENVMRRICGVGKERWEKEVGGGGVVKFGGILWSAWVRSRDCEVMESESISTSH